MTGQKKSSWSCLSEIEYRLMERLDVDPEDEDMIKAVLKLYNQGYAVRKICHILKLTGCEND